MSEMQFLSREGLPDLAYYSHPGRAPGIVYLPGYKSDMNNPKCLALEKFCSSSGHAFLRFDYTGCGSSKGDFESSLLGDWRNDVSAVLDLLTTGPQVLIGASMGSWLMCLAALDRPQRVVGLISTGTAVDTFVKLFQSLSEEVKADVTRKGFYDLPMATSDTGYYRITYRFFQEAEQHSILKHPIRITCPVRMLHGMDDDTISWHRSVEVAQQLESKDVSVILRTHGGHTLQDSDSLSQFVDIVANLMKSLTTDGGPFSAE